MCPGVSIRKNEKEGREKGGREGRKGGEKEERRQKEGKEEITPIWEGAEARSRGISKSALAFIS